MHSDVDNTYDLIVIGGGINGSGIANDASGRGLKVLLCEKGDLAQSTSSNSSKLIHGGLRYLEHYEFRLVKEALAERETLLKNAPHIIWPLRFILPHRPHLRPRWMIMTGLFLYDNLSKRTTLKRSKGINFDSFSPVINNIKKGFEYSDAWVDDARLVAVNAVSAKNNGATVKTRCACVKAIRGKGFWEITLEDTDTLKSSTVKCKMLVNAAGPWVADLFANTIKVNSPQNVRLVKGSHIVVPKIHDDPQAYILQNEDGRIVFVLPYEDDFSLIGTTDIEVKEDPSKIKISKAEIEYLIDVTNKHFKNRVSKEDIVHTFSGVRPLLDDESSSPQAITRDYTLEVDSENDSPPLLSIFGGKITTYRKLANAALDKIHPFFPHLGPAWTKDTVLPGGDFENQNSLLNEINEQYPWLKPNIAKRYVRSYGTLIHTVLRGCQNQNDMGEHFGAGLYACEVQYLIKYEFAKSLDDVIWRRSKIGLRLNDEEKNYLNESLSGFLNKHNSQLSEQKKHLKTSNY